MPTIHGPVLAIPVAEVMRAPVLTCGPEAPLPDVAALMADERIHAVVVTGVEGTAWAVVTAREVAAAADRAQELRARDVAATEVVTVPVTATLGEAADRFAAHELDHVLVTDSDHRPVGLISTLDVVRLVAGA